MEIEQKTVKPGIELGPVFVRASVSSCCALASGRVSYPMREYLAHYSVTSYTADSLYYLFVYSFAF